MIDPPTRLPVSGLSASSLRLYFQCPERWRRRHIEREREPSSPAGIVGHAAGRAEGHSYQRQVDGEPRLLVSDLLDTYSEEFNAKVAEDTGTCGVEWDGERPGRVKDSGARVLALYHRTVAPHVHPVAVERPFEISFPGLEWTFRGYLDVEDRDGAVIDLKSRGRTKGPVSSDEADGDVQVDSYLFAKRAEARSLRLPDSPAPFLFHNLVRHPNPTPGHVCVTPTARTHEQLDQFLATLHRVAAEIAWRAENDVWTGAPPGAWWCADRWCGFWATCPHGGSLRTAPAHRPRPARRPRLSAVQAAAKATSRKDGTTTAARVAAYLGVSVRSAAGSLTQLDRLGVVRSERPAKRYKTKPDVPLPGPNVYRLLDDGTATAQLTRAVRQLDRDHGREAAGAAA